MPQKLEILGVLLKMPHSDLKVFLTPSDVKTTYTEQINAGRAELMDALLKLEGAVVSHDVPTVTEAIDSFGDFSAKVSLIGQVKAGKTALANALLNVSGLLPSDVNPWTSVVTSIHVNRPSPKGKRAIFKFFDEADWDDMVSNGGRITSLAKKANLGSRVGELTRQIEELKQKTETRLGRNFKMLLGNHHSFSHFNSDLIKRYVCLGEDEISDDREGRFADLTKSADLYLDSDGFDYPITLADTPGVNDPFLVREAATLGNLEQSHICVVVLSAHQALSTVDLGLLRLLKRLRSDRIIVFVNRIDELSDPHNQIKEIRGFISNTLKKQKIDGEIPIIFGSAAWGDAAVTGHFDDLPEDSVTSLSAMVEGRKSELRPDAVDPFNVDNLSDLSGVSALRAMIGQKAWEQVYQQKLGQDANGARRIAERSLVYMNEANKGPEFNPDLEGIKQALKDIEAGSDAVMAALEALRDDAHQTVKMGMAAAYYGFVKAEKTKLENCLAQSGGVSEWTPDTEGLRTELNAVYNTYSADAVARLVASCRQSIETVSAAYALALKSKEGFEVAPQPLDEPPIPLSLMRTMSIDLRASNSLEWLRRKLDKSVYLTQFSDIAKQDLKATVDETCSETIDRYLDRAVASLQQFFEEHRQTIEKLPNISAEDIADELQGVHADTGFSPRINILRGVSQDLLRLDVSGRAGSSDQPSETAKAL